MSVNANSHRRRLPQPIHKRQRINNADKIKPLSPVIIFDYVGEYTQGVVMIDINNRSPAVLGAKMVGAFDQAFAHPLPSASFTLRIKRPGYDHFEYVRSINVSPTRYHQLQSRGQLAQAIAGARVFARFCETHRNIQELPSRPHRHPAPGVGWTP
ncbi:hypothetical protein CC2G_006956 [Coprinopsis cinerea AmutBmut pab1-1]|nr:hypothetical protein CC2G_006956 [Coprinopsis cinerea AmutBmut pab1-1]